MNVGSLFSGIGGIDLGLERAGMRVVFQAEANPYRRDVLQSHWPDVPCYEDVRSLGRDELQPVGRDWGANGSECQRDELDGAVDLLCGGFPCQDLSVAGRRAGLDGTRSSLFFEFARIADALRPTWLLVENVPGLLSSNGGRDFAVVYTTLADLGYGLAWRILDSRHFGVPQRRRRVFIVGHLGARSAEPFLPFLEGGGGDSEASGEAGKEFAYALADGSGTRTGSGRDSQDTFVTVAAPLSHGSNPNSNAAGRRREDDENLVAAYHFRTRENGSCFEETEVNVSRASVGGSGGAKLAIQTASAVRRLTPTECCRLQGFPDDWLGPPNEKPDSPRYAALGDAVTVPVAEWIGRRILEAA